MLEACIEQQERAPPKDVFKVSDDGSASAEMTGFQPQSNPPALAGDRLIPTIFGNA